MLARFAIFVAAVPCGRIADASAPIADAERRPAFTGSISIASNRSSASA